MWTRKDYEEQQESYYFNLFYSAILIYFLAIFTRALIISFSCLATSYNLHKIMIEKVLRAPIKFFDTTPIGRILTRLTQDIGTFDFIMPVTGNFVLNNTFRAFSILILICVSVPFMIIPAAIVIFLAVWIRKIVILPQND